MDWMLPFRPLYRAAVNQSGLSRRMLRHLFLQRQLGMGARVLDAGCGSGRLIRFLNEMGLEISGFDPDLDAVSRACRRNPEIDIRFLDPGDRLPYSERSFDLVLARNLPAHRSNLAGREALWATAHLLASVIPGGELVLVLRTQPHSSAPGGHLRSCLARHLGVFGSQITVASIADPIWSRSTWRWIRGRQPRCGYLTATIRLPLEPKSVQEWEQIAETASHWTSDSCCEWTRTQTLNSPDYPETLPMNATSKSQRHAA